MNYAEWEDQWATSIAKAWAEAERGKMKEALQHYEHADALAASGWPGHSFSLNPRLNLLRHAIGTAPGLVAPMTPTEDLVVQLGLRVAIRGEEPTATGMKLSTIPAVEQLAEHILAYHDAVDPSYHLQNIRQELQHVQVLSTGRCGTISLFHLLERSKMMPFHNWMLNVGYDARYEIMCRQIENRYDDMWSTNFYIQTRAAEWIGAINCGMPLVNLCHLDLVFAPAWAKIHPQSKFIYLHRDPVKVFRSFFSKNQWGMWQTQAVNYKFEGSQFQWRWPRQDLPVAIAWMIRFTEVYGRAFARAFPDRTEKISADALFAQDRDECERLIAALGADLDLNETVEHFALPYNEKRHKVAMTDEQVALAQESFEFAYDKLGGGL